MPHPFIEEYKAEFKDALRDVMVFDVNYEVRKFLVYKLVYLAQHLEFEAGFRIDPADPKWPVAYIELPTGQVSWHMPEHKRAWDNHTTPDKFKRINEYLYPETPTES